MANSNQQTPTANSPKTDSILDNATHDFFYNNQKFKRSAFESFGSNASISQLPDQMGPHYIQPKSRYAGVPPSSSVVEVKREDDGLGLPALKINRSTTNLSDGNLSNLHPSIVRTRSSLSKPFVGLTLHSNSSTNSLAIAEEDERSDPMYPYNLDTDTSDRAFLSSQKKLAEFGGFSNDTKGNLFDQSNIFETADWDIVFSQKGNVSVTKAVKLSAEHNIIKNRKWVGTIAMPSDEVPEHITNDIAAKLSAEYNSEVIFPGDIVFQGHYTSFCKQILWPTFHYQIPDDPKSKAFEDHSWGHYQLLNQMVADKIIEVYQRENANVDPEDPENMIWIHDYHLLLVPLMVRKKLPNAKIGLFLHVSFPSSEVFRCFAQRNDILKGILGANVISFQTHEYVRHFAQTCNRLLLADVNDDGISYEGNFTQTNTIPVGIDSDSMTQVVNSQGVTDWRKLIKERWPHQHLIVSRDKLDKLRGIKQKLLAYEKFLISNPEYINNTVLIQICMDKCHDPIYETEIMHIVDRINSLPENITLAQPVVFLQKDIAFDQYVALQCEADVFVVSSMREGLNLTCHEFITATSEKKSPLILSEFTGSSPLLECGGKGALLMNPWDTKSFSEQFKRALTMSPAEKLERWTNCNKIVTTSDSRNWVASCLKSINESWEKNKRRNLNNLIPFSSDEFDKFYAGKTSDGYRLFLLNFETSITTLSIGDEKPSTASITSGKSAYTEPSRLTALLNDLLEDPRNQIYLTSFLKRDDLDRLYRRYPRLGLIAENGGYIKFIGSKNWVSLVDESDSSSWIPQVSQLIQSKVDRLPGSHCEIEDCTVRFHTGKSFLENRERTLDAMGECIQHVNDVFQDSDGVHASLIKNMVIVQKNQLSLRAIQFITSVYNSKHKLASLIEEFGVRQIPENSKKNDTKSPTTTEDCETSNFPQSSGLSSVFIAGATTIIDEPNYEYGNKLHKEKDVDNVSTVAILGNELDVRTSANFGVNGVNELLRVLSKSSNI